ncbi:MAG: M42 family metallopeptidase [Candidatus Omnitrophica bacterium]|nr:M42 family metallopeptidase [Candidatus Omnitrophota bacterium]
MEKQSFEFLTSLIAEISPSGYEQDAIRTWKKRTAPFADTAVIDVHGNCIASVGQNKKPRVMLAGHIDEIGYMIKYIDKEGFLYFSTVGGIDPHLMPGERVSIKTAAGIVLGVIGRKPIHYLEAEERKTVAKLEQLWIDIGAAGEKKAREQVEIGDVAVPAVGLERLRDDIVVGRGFDDRAGAFVVSETLRLLKGKTAKASVFGVATVQEEVGLRGASTSAYGITPDIGICAEVTFATDSPDMDKKKAGDIAIGKGPVIARGPNINPKVFELLVDTAKKENIPYQVQGIPSATGTDANVIQLTKSGVATGLVEVPLRYMHTPVELLSLKDLENTAKLLDAFIMRLNDKISFLP